MTAGDLRAAFAAFRVPAQSGAMHPMLLFLVALDQRVQVHGRCIETWAASTDVELHRRAVALATSPAPGTP